MLSHESKRDADITSRLKTSIWASALMQRAQSEGAFAVILHKGDPDSGAVIVSVRDANAQYVLYQSAPSMDGRRIWIAEHPISEFEAGQKISKRRSRDEDVWVIEIEDKHGRHFLTESVQAAHAPLLKP